MVFKNIISKNTKNISKEKHNKNSFEAQVFGILAMF